MACSFGYTPPTLPKLPEQMTGNAAGKEQVNQGCWEPSSDGPASFRADGYLSAQQPKETHCRTGFLFCFETGHLKGNFTYLPVHVLGSWLETHVKTDLTQLLWSTVQPLGLNWAGAVNWELNPKFLYDRQDPSPPDP